MATDDLDITSNDWRIVRENLVQLHCEDVSWDKLQIRFHLTWLDIYWGILSSTSVLWFF